MSQTLNPTPTKSNGTPPVNEPETNKTTQTTKPANKRHKYFLILAGALAICAVAGLFWWIYAQGHEETEDSYVDGHITTISSRVAGTVAKVLVEDNQIVKLGEPLVRLDPSDYKARVDKLSASLSMEEKQTLASQSKIGQSVLSAKGQA